MDDVASARSENANLRKIQQKLLQWDNKDKPLAPLSTSQLDAIENLTILCAASNADVSVISSVTPPKVLLRNFNISNNNRSFQMPPTNHFPKPPPPKTPIP